MILPVNLSRQFYACSVKDKAQVMRLENNQGFLLCSSSWERLKGIWPLLQSNRPPVHVCPQSQSRYGYVFSSGLWPELQKLARFLSVKWMDEFWGEGVEISDASLATCCDLAYLRVMLRNAPEYQGLPLVNNEWKKRMELTPSCDVTNIVNVPRPLPVATWLENWEKAHKYPKATICSATPLPISAPFIESEPKDYLSKLEGKPLEQILGNYQGRESERRIDPFDKNAR